MRIDVLNKMLAAALAIILLGFAPYLVAQDKPAEPSPYLIRLEKVSLIFLLARHCNRWRGAKTAVVSSELEREGLLA
jgi:hypothetical protein